MKTAKTLDALLFLSEEPDEHLFINIAEAIVSYGEKALPSLKERLEKSSNGLHHQRLVVKMKDELEKIKEQLFNIL